MLRIKSLLSVISISCLAGLASEAMGQASARSGPNPADGTFRDRIEISWNPLADAWTMQVDLIVDPKAGPMSKHFQSPQDATGGPILLDALQPLPQVLWEDFLILPVPGTAGVPVTDWHEEIHTPGWEWVVPGDARFPNLFPASASLITFNGQPWPSKPVPMVPNDPSQLWVKFPPIPPGNVLDIHKALLWVGTAGNRIWGDNIDNSGVTVDESVIEVWEHPTIPEPSTAVLLCLGALPFLLNRRR